MFELPGARNLRNHLDILEVVDVKRKRVIGEVPDGKNHESLVGAHQTIANLVLFIQAVNVRARNHLRANTNPFPYFAARKGVGSVFCDH